MGLIYKVISYISPKTKKYCKEEINISKDAKSKFEVLANIVKSSLDAELLIVTELMVDAKLRNVNGSRVK